MIFRREDSGSFISIVRTDSVQQSHKVEEKAKAAGNSNSILLIKVNSALTTYVGTKETFPWIRFVERLRDYITTNITNCGEIKLSKTNFQ